MVEDFTTDEEGYGCYKGYRIGMIEKRPIFEVITGDGHFKIYENGTIDGFPEGAEVINSIQIVFNMRLADFLDKAERVWND